MTSIINVPILKKDSYFRIFYKKGKPFTNKTPKTFSEKIEFFEMSFFLEHIFYKKS